MSWTRQAEQSGGMHLESDFERAGYRLVSEQVIYAIDRGNKTTYDLIVRHFGLYRELLGKLGIELLHNHFHSYIAAIPRVHVAAKMRLNETRLALLLRKLYDDRMHAAEIDQGEATVGLEDLEPPYRDSLGLPLPAVGELRELLKELKRYGIVRIEEAEDDQPFMVVVRPGIVDVLGESALLQLASYAPEEEETEAPEEPNEAA